MLPVLVSSIMESLYILPYFVMKEENQSNIKVDRLLTAFVKTSIYKGSSELINCVVYTHNYGFLGQKWKQVITLGMIS